MLRFLMGVAIGGAATYWYLTGQIPWQDDLSYWFSQASSSVSGGERGSAASGMIEQDNAARPPR
jgi:hypothetical protein